MNIAAATRRNVLLVELREGCRGRKAQHTVTQVELSKALKYLCPTEKIVSVYEYTTQERMVGMQVMVHMSYRARQYKEILLLLFST